MPPEQHDFMPPEFFLDEDGDRVTPEEYRALGFLYGLVLVHIARDADPGGASFHELFALCQQSSKTIRSICFDNKGRALGLVCALVVMMERREIVVCSPHLGDLVKDRAKVTVHSLSDVRVQASSRIEPAFWFIHEHYLPALLWLAQGEATPTIMQGRLPG